MKHSVPMLALAGFFAVAGLALFAMTLREPKTPPSAAPQKKAELREAAARQHEIVKMRIGGAVLVLFGAALVFLS